MDTRIDFHTKLLVLSGDNGVTEDLNQEQKEKFRFEVREILKEKIYSQEEGWVADYVRLRVEAVKI